MKKKKKQRKKVTEPKLGRDPLERMRRTLDYDRQRKPAMRRSDK